MGSRTPDDERLGALMQDAQAGDSDAYLLLLEEITPRLRQVIARRRRDTRSADVEDLVQDVLLTLHVARASYDPGRPFFPWFLAIVRNRMADGARRFGRQAAHEVQVEDLDVTFAGDSTNNHSETLVDIPALQDAIRALPAGQREAIELLKLRELSLKEASAATGVSTGALKVATHRAIGALGRMLASGGLHGRER
jgi:RNA polymerase sigma-70 factor (ECF subfamily)